MPLRDPAQGLFEKLRTAKVDLFQSTFNNNFFLGRFRNKFGWATNSNKKYLEDKYNGFCWHDRAPVLELEV